MPISILSFAIPLIFPCILLYFTAAQNQPLCGVFYPNSQYDNHMFLNFLADAWFNPDRLHPKGKRRRIGVCVCVCLN